MYVHIVTYIVILVYCHIVLWCCIVILLCCCIVTLSYCHIVLFVILFCHVDDVLIVICYVVIREWFFLFCQTSADAHEYMLALKECLLAELKLADGTSDVTASGEGYDETLHSLMQTFWDMFDSGQITQTVTYSKCTCATTMETPFSDIWCNFQTHIMRRPRQTWSAPSIVSLNTILHQRTFMTVIGHGFMAGNIAR